MNEPLSNQQPLHQRTEVEAKRHRIEDLAACLSYRKQHRAMLFAGALVPADLDLVISALKHGMSHEEVAAAEKIDSNCPPRVRCNSTAKCGRQCELFTGHPGEHIFRAYVGWADEEGRS